MGVFIKSCFSIICFVTTLALQEQANFDIVKGRKVVNATKTIEKVSQFKCAASCLRLAENGECKVAGYHSGSRECFLSSHMLEAVVVNTTNDWKVLIPEIGKYGYTFYILYFVNLKFHLRFRITRVHF